MQKIKKLLNKISFIFYFLFFLKSNFFYINKKIYLNIFIQCASAQARLRAKLKHISQRSVKKETNQDSLSNGE